MLFYEVSAKSAEEVQTAFEAIVKKALEAAPKEPDFILPNTVLKTDEKANELQQINSLEEVEEGISLTIKMIRNCYSRNDNQGMVKCNHMLEHLLAEMRGINENILETWNTKHISEDGT